MKGMVVLLGLVTASLLPGVAAVTVMIRVYNATGKLDIRNDSLTLGTRVLLTCDVIQLPEGNETLSYRWYRDCPVIHNSRCEIRDGDPYYSVVNDTLLVDVTSWDQGGRYYCTVHGLQEIQRAVTRTLSVAGSPAPFLYTPTSLLPEHSVLTDVQQATGRNGQQWITCSSGGQGTRPQIWMGSELVANSSTANSVKIGLGTQHLNGLYHCLTGQSQEEYFSLFLRNSGIALPTASASVKNATITWTFTSPDGSQMEGYIVEFECRVRNMTFVEKYLSVNASGGTGQVATNVSCFGGLGQPYRVKVWAVSGPNISPALVCSTDGQCMMEAPATGTPPPVSTDNSTSRPTDSSTETATKQPDGTFIGVGVGAGMLLLLVLLTSVVVLVSVVVVVVVRKRKGANKQKRHRTKGNNLQCNNTVVVMKEMEKKKNGVGPSFESTDIYDTPDGYQYEEKVMHEEGSPMPFPPHEAVERTEHGRIPAPKKPFIPARAEDSCTAMNIHEYDLQMRKMGMTTNGWDGIVVSGEEGEQCVYDDTIELTYQSQAHSAPWQLSRGSNRY